ncbi:MAG: hypothetical protein CMJ18_17710 [Phycisphaeraceae bacterium]|nr:hypothetical protein [Phycisphaeraceae bacterium]
MTSRERVLTALSHRTPDRPPLNYFGTAETDAILMKHLDLPSREALLRHLGADMRYVAPRYVGPSHFSGMCGYSTGDTDVWGVGWQQIQAGVSTYNEVASHPLADARTLGDVRAHPWPQIDWFDCSGLKQQIRELNDPHPHAIVFAAGTGFFETPWYLRGFERFLMDLVEFPDIADFLMGKVTAFVKELTLRAIESTDGLIDIVWSSSDVGMQTGMLMSPDIWRRQIKPHHRELITPFRDMGIMTRYHTDGSVEAIIEDLIEMGLDLLDPIQPRASGMDAANLARRFGDRLAFYGGLDTQELLPTGTAHEVEREMIRLIEVLGRQGGYIAAASNAIQADVPPENVVAMFRAASSYRY